jgi:hypothetical protein
MDRLEVHMTFQFERRGKKTGEMTYTLNTEVTRLMTMPQSQPRWSKWPFKS